MAKKKEVISENYLENIPVRREGLRWDTDDKGIVTLYVHNTGLMKKITQKLLSFTNDIHFFYQGLHLEWCF